MDIGLEDGYVKDLQMPLTKEEKSERRMSCFMFCLYFLFWFYETVMRKALRLVLDIKFTVFLNIK